MFSIEDQIKKIPKEPGCYLFYDRFDRIIYIGKAINLRNRVRSYWNETSWKDRPKLRFMVPKIKRLETIITKSEKEALILEANLIFKNQPRYNVLLKDDKTFPWLVITYDERYPRLLPVRQIEKFKDKFIPAPKYAKYEIDDDGKKQFRRFNKNKSSNKFFGPYPNVGAMWENLHLVYELFPLRHRKTPAFKTRPCLNYDMGKCLGPCQKLISEEDYQNMLNQVEMLLSGERDHLKEIIEEQMFRASDNEEFEEAAKYRDQLRAIDKFNERQNVISDNDNIDQDVFALVVDDSRELACAQVFKTRGGKVVNRDTIDLEFNFEDSEEEIFESLFVQYYTKLNDNEIPKYILLSHDLKDSAQDEESKKQSSLEFFSSWLSEKRGSKVDISTPKRGDKYSQVELAKRNAKVIIEQLKLEQMEEASKNIDEALTRLQEELDMRTEPSRIECFDISHIQGSDTVASMVCFIDGMPAKNQYRKFKISTDQNDDFASMREVIFRRFKKYRVHASDEESASSDNEIDSLPNLVIIDGGKGQLSSAVEIMKELELDHVQLVGLAKKEEELFLPGQSRPVVLDRKSSELFLIQRIRNEAHRFAITYHRHLRSKRALKSGLDDIPGLGPKKKQLLLDSFGTLKKIKDAKPEEIAELQGFSVSLAEKILKYIK